MKSTFPVFRAGKYPQGEYTPDDVKDIFEKYDPDFLSAPFTTDHKKDGPAYGYAKVLKFENDTLFASKDDLADNLKDAIKEKHFRRVSVEIYKDLPEKGRYLKAISFLGVKAPQVKGFEGDIEQTSFKDAESESIDFEVNWEGDEFELVPLPAQKDSKDKDDPGSKEKTESFEELQAKIEKLESEKTALSEKFQATETEKKQAQDRLEEIELNQRRLEFEQFLNARVAYGNLTPANKDKVMDIMTALDSVERFEQDGKEADPVKLFQEFIESLPKVVDPEEEATKKGAETNEFSGSQELADKARTWIAKQKENGKVIGFAQAVTEVEKGIAK